MNLSPEWVPYLHERGFDAVHWSTFGAHNAPASAVAEFRVVASDEALFSIV
jgi:predicted nuclease of predicted toxin-antitoxin system